MGRHTCQTLYRALRAMLGRCVAFRGLQLRDCICLLLCREEQGAAARHGLGLRGLHQRSVSLRRVSTRQLVCCNSWLACTCGRKQIQRPCTLKPSYP